MRPQYWISIFAILGSITGSTLSLIFGLNNIVIGVACTFIGVVIGTFIFTLQQNNATDTHK